MDNVQIFPSRKRIEPNDKLTEKLFSMSTDTYEKILTDGNTFYLIEVKNHKKYGDILSPLCIKLINGYLDKTPMDQFDRFVLAACISEWVKENTYTTPNIIYRHLTGKTGSDSEAPDETKEEILQSIRRLMCTEITINMTDYCAKLGYNKGKPFELTSTMLPCSYAKGLIVNGQPSTVIKILDEPPLLKIARFKAQLLTYEEKLLDVPHQHNSIDIITIKNYVMQRIQEIIKHKLTPTIRFDDVFEKCGLIDIRNNKKMRMRKVIVELMEHIKSNGEIVSYTINKEQNKFSSISIQYQLK